MQNRKLQKFADMVALYNQVGDVKADEMSDIDTIVNLSENDDLPAIGYIYNENGEFHSADELMEEHFGHNRTTLNHLADENHFQRIAS